MLKMQINLMHGNNIAGKKIFDIFQPEPKIMQSERNSVGNSLIINVMACGRCYSVGGIGGSLSRIILV